jgi:hypothetical protein
LFNPGYWKVEFQGKVGEYGLRKTKTRNISPNRAIVTRRKRRENAASGNIACGIPSPSVVGRAGPGAISSTPSPHWKTPVFLFFNFVFFVIFVVKNPYFFVPVATSPSPRRHCSVFSAARPVRYPRHDNPCKSGCGPFGAGERLRKIAKPGDG